MAEEKTIHRPKWIADEYDGCVYVHDVDGESVQLNPGDRIPAGYEEKVGPHIPTTFEKPRSTRIREIDGEYERPASEAGVDLEGFDPGQHKTSDVVDYVRRNPEHAQAVLDRERAGKNRRSIFTELGG